MRSSKNRQRSKSNRQRSIGNIVNRVFDSSGPEGKVRGTPQQIIDKYLMLARDAQLGNDRVAEQNFLQHAEHYTRMLGEAQRELQREQELRQAQHGQHGGDRPQNGQQNGNQNGHQNGRERYEQHGERPEDAAQPAYFADEAEQPEDDGPGIVETPEAQAEPVQQAETGQQGEGGQRGDRRPRNRGPRRPRGPREEGSTAPSDDTPDEPKAAE